MSSNKPERVSWAVEVLSVQPDEKILEIGCGRGQAVELICKQLRTGKIVGIDRSAKAITAAESNNRDCIDSMKAQLINIALAELKLKEFFDKIFAVNVNAFWTGPEKEIAVLRSLMNKRSQLYLFYEPPSVSQLEKIIESCQRQFEGELEIVQVLRKRLSLNRGVCIMAQKSNA
jgi:tRNA A58 N-methylase Trm61